MKNHAGLVSFSLAAALVGLWGASAQAALGGPNGVVIPYAGKLELDGALVTGLVDFEFGVAPAALQPVPTTPVDCRFTLTGTPVTNGEFAVSIVIPPPKESCVKGQDVHLEVRVARAGGTRVFLGKQRVTPVVAAATSGGGDFAVTGALSAGALTATSAAVSGNVDVTNGTVKVNSPDDTGSTNIAEFKSANQASGVGIGFNTVRAIGSNANEPLNLEGKGAGAVNVNDDLNVSGNLFVTGSVLAVCRANFTAIEGGRLCISTNMKFAGPMMNTGGGYSAISNCKVDDKAHVCTHEEVQQACGNGFDVYDGLGVSGGVGVSMWFGGLVGNDLFMTSEDNQPGGCASDNMSNGPHNGVTGRANFRCCY